MQYFVCQIFVAKSVIFLLSEYSNDCAATTKIWGFKFAFGKEENMDVSN
jgi:hypothetical protein